MRRCLRGERMTEMKLKKGFVLREIMGETVVLPSGNQLNLNMMITLNGTGKFLWEMLEMGAEIEEMTAALLAEYDVDEATARASVERFVAKVRENGFFED